MYEHLVGEADWLAVRIEWSVMGASSYLRRREHKPRLPAAGANAAHHAGPDDVVARQVSPLGGNGSGVRKAILHLRNYCIHERDRYQGLACPERSRRNFSRAEQPSGCVQAYKKNTWASAPAAVFVC